MEIKLNKGSPEYLVCTHALRANIHERKIAEIRPAFKGDLFDEEVLYMALDLAYKAGAERVQKEIQGKLFEIEASNMTEVQKIANFATQIVSEKHGN